MIELLFLLLFTHAIADYLLQGDFLSRAKNHAIPLEYFPWWLALATHALIHAGMVLLVTTSLTLALVEFCAHAVIDYGKCAKHYGIVTDQILHVVCKMVYVVLLLSAY